MATATKLTYEQFQAQFGPDNKAYEFWYGEAIRKGRPTWVHALLQKIILRLLDDAGYISAPELELRIDPDAHPRPDVIATKTKPSGRYPTAIYLVDPSDRSVVLWKDGATAPCTELASIPVQSIWDELDKQHSE